MDSNLQSPPRDNADIKAAFRKPSNDAANRKYRRHSPVNGSSSSEGSPERDRSSMENPAKVSERHQRRKDEGMELDRDSGRNSYGRIGDSTKYSDQKSSRVSYNDSRHGDYVRHDKHEVEEDRNLRRLSSRSGRESRGGPHYDSTRQESEHSQSRDYSQNVDKYDRDRYDGSGHRSKDKEKETSPLEHQKYRSWELSSDRAGYDRRYTNSNSDERGKDRHARDRDYRDEKRDYRRGVGDHRSDRTYSHSEIRGHRSDLTSARDNGGSHLEEAFKDDSKESDGQKLAKGERKKYDDGEYKRDKDHYRRPAGERSEDKTAFVSENKESPAKKPKLFGAEKGADYDKDVDGKQSPNPKEAQESGNKVILGQAPVNNSGVANDLNAAKVAAMKAAELVNQNLVGGGFMSTDQKKKLLWGNKKSTPAEEAGHRWDTALFGDRERQEKFNKLMGVKGEVKLEQKPDNQNGNVLLQAEKQKELQIDLEKQYTAGLRRRDGRTVGLGL